MNNSPVTSACHVANTARLLLVVGTVVMAAKPVGAVEFERGQASGSWDTTVSYGIRSRVENRDQRIIGTANGGSAHSVNADDGNLNYDTGIVSNAVKITSEIELNARNIGGFIRGTAFYDYENMEGDRQKAPLTPQAEDLVGRDAELLDAYLWTGFDLGTRPAEARIGNQLLSWGESTFIQNSINTINPVNVSKLRVPGAELREALTPVPLITAALTISDNTDFEFFYQLRWKETVIDPPGSYFSTNDFVGEGGERVMLGFGAIPDTVPPSSGAVVPRRANREADNGGQFGIAARTLVPKWNDTELGFYFINYHSRLPVINARTGSAAAAAGVDPNGLTYAETAGYYISYPDDIRLFGVSFNTSVGQTGVALQGEISHRRNVPLQIDDVELLFAALGAQDNLSPGNTPAAPLAAFNQLGLISFDTDIPGHIERNVTQFQVTATKVFGPSLGADQATLVGEAGVTHVHDMPNKDTLRLNGPGTFVSGNEPLAGFHFGVFETAEHFADATSWGYRILGRLSFNNAFASINLHARAAWLHDVDGISPGPGGNFLEGRKAAAVGLEGTYQNAWSADISYTRYTGAGRYNLINDRDFVASTIKYSF